MFLSRVAVLMALLLVGSMANNVGTFERYRQLGRPVVHGLDHLPPLAARFLARDTAETDWETVTVTDIECSQTCTATTTPCGTVPGSAPPVVTPTYQPPRVTITPSPSPPVVITGTASATSTESVPSPTSTSVETTATTTVPVSLTESVPCPSTEDTTATATATATETVSCSGSAQCPSTTERPSAPTGEVPAPTQGVSTTLTIVPKPPVTSQFTGLPTTDTIRVTPTWSTHHVSSTKTVISIHPTTRSTSEEAPTTTGSSTPAVPTQFNMASRLNSLTGYVVGACLALLFLLEAL